MTSKRLLLIEFVIPGGIRSERTVFFPFIQGLARQHRVEVRSVRMVVDVRRRWDIRAGRTMYVEPGEADLALLRAEYEQFRPTHVMLTEVLSARAREALESLLPGPVRHAVMPEMLEIGLGALGPYRAPADASPSVELATAELHDRTYLARPSWVLRWLGVDDNHAAGEFMVESVTPDYEVEALNERARTLERKVTILGGFSCVGRPSVRDNVHFKNLDLSGCILVTGCSFCGGSPPPPMHSAQVDTLALAERQLRRVLQTPGIGDGGRVVYGIHDLGLFHNIDRFFELVSSLELPPASFVFGPRIDDVLATRERIEKLLPVLQSSGHEIRLEVMGLENFSPSQMLLYNKHISVAQVDELLALLASWSRSHPAVFDAQRCGIGATEWSMILFNPWTTFEDIRINLAAAEQRRFSPSGLWLASCLMMRCGTPLEAYARSQPGILCDEYDDPGLRLFPILAMRDLWGVVPWRFRDPRVADYYRILIRIWAAQMRSDTGTLFEGDAEFESLTTIFEAGRRNALEVAVSLLDLMQPSTGAPAAQAEPGTPAWREELLRLATGRPAGPESRSNTERARQLARMKKLLSMLSGSKSKAFANVQFRGVEDVSVHHRQLIRLEAQMEGRRIVLTLAESGDPEPFWFQSRFFNVSHERDAGPGHPRDEARVRLLVSLLDRCVAPSGADAIPGL